MISLNTFQKFIEGGEGCQKKKQICRADDAITMHAMTIEYLR